jgi:hypothetical protein
MIAKRIAREKATSDFGRLGRYILEAKNETASILWTRTAEYILDAKGHGEKVAWSRISNCTAEIPVLAIEEIQVTQANNTRAKSDKTYHLVVSFREGEKPTREQVEDIEDTICERLGYQEHQRISAVHQDTENLHIHIAINKVHPGTLRCIEPYYDHYKLNALCRELEIKHGLESDNRIEQTRISGRAGDMEAYAGQDSLMRWVKENVAESLLECLRTSATWQTIHQALARYGLEIRPRGAGLVIGLPGDKLAVKASSIDRSLSMKALTDSLGPFEAPDESLEKIKPEKRYEKGINTQTNGHEQLFEDYQQQRQAAIKAKDESLTQLRQEHQQYADDLRGWYQERFQSVKADGTLSSQEKREARQKLRQQRQEDFAKSRQREKEQRRTLAESHAIPTWQSFLQEAAGQGNPTALTALRSRRKRQQRMGADLLRCKNAEEARHIVFRDLKPQVRKNGEISYRVQDGGLVLDESDQVRVVEVTAGAAFLALSLADARFKGQALVVEGSVEFKRQIVDMAKKQGLEIRFADPVLEKIRQQVPSQMQSKARNL